MSHILDQLFSVIVFNELPQFGKCLESVELFFNCALAEDLSERVGSLLIIVDSDQSIKLALKAKLLDDR